MWLKGRSGAPPWRRPELWVSLLGTDEPEEDGEMTGAHSTGFGP